MKYKFHTNRKRWKYSKALQIKRNKKSVDTCLATVQHSNITNLSLLERFKNTYHKYEYIIKPTMTVLNTINTVVKLFLL